MAWPAQALELDAPNELAYRSLAALPAGCVAALGNGGGIVLKKKGGRGCPTGQEPVDLSHSMVWL